MTNLLNGAHVANKLFSTIARLRLLLVMFLTLTVTTNAWGADVTISVSSDTWTNTGTSSSGSLTKVSKSGVTVSSDKGYKDGTTAIREYSGGIITVSSNDNITKIVFTSTANKGSKYGPDCIALKSGSAGTYTTSSNSNLGTWTGTAKSITFTCSAQFRWKQVVVTTASSHTVTWTINPTEGGSLSPNSGNTTTVTPYTAYTYDSPAYTVTPSGKASVVQNDNKFTATPSANCTIQINMVKKKKNTYIDQVHGSEEQIGYGTHNVPMLTDKTPATTGSCEQQHWHFMGWVTEANKENPTDANIIAPNTSVDANEATYYAVWAKGSETNGGNVETTITIPNETLIKSLTNSYGDKSFSYEGYTFNLNACVQSSYCQMRDNTTISFIQIPTLPGPITKISCTDCKNASNSAYTGTLHFKSSKTRGNSDTNDIAKITYNSVNSFEWEIDNDTHKTGYLLTSAGLRLKDLSITYITSGETTTYSDYITQCITEPSR